MPISHEQRKLLIAVEDGICAFLIAVFATVSLSLKMLGQPRKTLEKLTDETLTSIVPQPLTYLAGASLLFLLSLRFARGFASFVFLRNFNSISFDLPLKELSVSACMLAVIPTVLGLYCLARLVALVAGTTRRRNTASNITSVILAFELYLLSLSLLASRFVTLLAVGHEALAGIIAYAILIVISAAVIWPAVLSIKASAIILQRNQWRLAFPLTTACLLAPNLVLSVFMLQYGHADLEPPQTTCVLTRTGFEAMSASPLHELGQRSFGVATILINRGPTTIFVTPPRSSRIVTGKLVYEDTVMINFRNSQLLWNWPDQPILPVEPEKSLVITGEAILPLDALDHLKHDASGLRADLVVDLHVLTSNGSAFTVGCVTNNVAIR